MGELSVSILIVVVVGLVVGAILILVNRKDKGKVEAIRQLAVSRGWHFQEINDPQKKGVVLWATDWRFESISSSSDHQSESGSPSVAFRTSWFTETVKSTDGLVLIGPKVPSIALGNMGNFILQQVLRLMLGDDADQAEGLSEVNVGRDAFDKKYSIWAVSEESAQSVLTFNIENALLNWKLKELPVIKMARGGTWITLKEGRVDKTEDILAVIDLGLTFLQG